MARLRAAENPDPRFKEFQQAELRQIPGGTASSDYHIIAGELIDLEQEEKGSSSAYHAEEPPEPVEITFPRLLSGDEELNLSREELELEIGLILEMRAGNDFDTGTALYSVTAVQPMPFVIADDDLEDLFDLPGPALSNARAGFLIHEDLYELQSDPNKLHDLIEKVAGRDQPTPRDRPF